MNSLVRNILITAFGIVFIGLIASNILLRRQLTAAETALRTSGVVSPGEGFRQGDAMPRFTARDRDGHEATLGGPTGHDTILVLVHPRCKVCDGVVGDIAMHPPANISVVSIMPQRLSANDVSKLPPSVPLYFLDHIGTSPISQHAHIVPQILHVGANGRIADVCRSLLDCAAKACGTCATAATGH
ncbi:MAG TPA: hypothetical protein VF713_12985 [Thermoanaerobaculia bacterium]